MGARGRWLRERRGPRSAGLASGSSRPRRAESFRRLRDARSPTSSARPCARPLRCHGPERQVPSPCPLVRHVRLPWRRPREPDGGPQIFTSHPHFPSLSPKSAFRQRPSARLAPPNARDGAFPGASRSWSVHPFGAASRARRMLKEPGRCLLSAFRTGAARRSEGDVERSPALHASPPFPFA